MNSLGPDAQLQATKDAGAKIQAPRKPALSGISWLIGQGWKTQFIIAAVALFALYAAAVAALEFFGLRPTHARLTSARPNCDAAELTLEARVTCQRAEEKHRREIRDKRRERINAWGDRFEAKQEAEVKERARQEALELKQKFEARLALILAGPTEVPNRDARWWLERELYVDVFEILKRSDHPMYALKKHKYTKANIQDVRALKEATQSHPDAYELRKRLHEICYPINVAGPSCLEHYGRALQRMSYAENINFISVLAVGRIKEATAP